MSVKGLGNTFDFSPKWARTLLAGIFHGIFKETLPKKAHSRLSNVNFD